MFLPIKVRKGLRKGELDQLRWKEIVIMVPENGEEITRVTVFTGRLLWPCYGFELILLIISNPSPTFQLVNWIKLVVFSNPILIKTSTLACGDSLSEVNRHICDVSSEMSVTVSSPDLLNLLFQEMNPS